MAIQLRASSSFSSAFSTRSYTHDVFLSFRGEDTRSAFTGHLYWNLLQKGINTFIDDELTRGEKISQALLRAIEESKLSLIIFSENYAFSKWCLDELVHILGCRRSKNQMVRPIFYKVDPSDVRNQRGTFGEALAQHERRFQDDMDLDEVSRWREALSEAANLSGWHFSGTGYEYEFIDKIVEEISAQVKEPTYLDMPKYRVGLDSRVERILEMLDVGGSDVRMVGIWGIGGIGKTTIAKAVYNTIAHKFDGSCFLANVREGSEQHGGLVNLQNILLSSIVGQKELKINNIHEGITLLREKLRHKRVLLVVDDVDDLDQLEKLAGRTDWFGHGSGVIITTRDKHLLIAHQVKPIYKVHELGHHEALELFNSNAFKDNKNLDDNEKLLVTTVVKYAQGIPLALEVLGSYLCDTSIHKWQAMLDGFKKNPPRRIQDIFIISYDGLQDTVQKVFLDIACFFKGWKRNEMMQILEGCDRINPEYSIKVLEEKALIYVGGDGQICMHDLLEGMGKDKDLQESTEPGERSRLWRHEDVQEVLIENTGTSKTEGIMIKMTTADEIRLNPKCFKKMRNLKIFININGRFCGKVDCYPNQLRLLEWRDYPLESLPFDFNMKNLIQLNMPRSRISCFKGMQNLKSLNLSECKFVAQSPDLSGSPKLEFLDLSRCERLKEVHSSVGSLEKLVHLNLGGCFELERLPEKVNWRSLKDIILDQCFRLESFPEIVGEMKYMTSLSLLQTGIKALPSSIGYLINLQSLRLLSCRSLTDLPCSIYELQKLTWVLFFDCPKLVRFPNKVDSEVLPTYSKVSHDNRDSLSKRKILNSLELEPDTEFDLARPLLAQFYFTRCNLSNIDFLASLDCASSLVILDLTGSPIVILPECIINKFVKLWHLFLSGCRRLVAVPELPPSISRLDVRDCVSLERISKLSNILERKESQIMIEEMDLTNCWRLCQNLVEMANKDDDDEVDADLFSRLLSKFTIRFPVPRSEVPEWFSCQMDFKGHRRFEFYIETLANFKWDNTGLAVCVAVDQKPQVHEFSNVCCFDVRIYINEEGLWEPNCVDVQVDSRESDHVWLHYVPFLDVRVGFGRPLPITGRPLPPFKCRVSIDQWKNTNASLKSCGVHLVMPPNEDVSMKLIRAENLTSKLSGDELGKMQRLIGGSLIRECPEESKEAVASLMVTAARFSDLPEFCDIRPLFQLFKLVVVDFYSPGCGDCRALHPKIKQELGGQVRIMLSGAASLPRHVEEFIRRICCGGCFTSLGNAYPMIGTVGAPMTTIEAQLESVPELGYDALSSDIGEWQPNGAMKVIDRKKEVLKLSQGEYVAVESIESKYLQCPLVTSLQMISLHLNFHLVGRYGFMGTALSHFLLLHVVVPGRKVSALEDWAAEHHLTDDYKSLCQNLKARNYILDELIITGQKQPLRGFELLKAASKFGSDGKEGR
ncbi:TMV resistance protein N-like [Rosa rugosa]|uniref:TMV resistance protein N-like n=1 Tax=Rosa rugosa TaxID=74645 RepID=UPI002B414013|nr:TMV resistance protein N-like [Rosa rugosa]